MTIEDMEATLDRLRKAEKTRDNVAPAINTSSYQDLLGSKHITHEEIQMYLLLKILDRLELIASRMDK